MNGKATTKIDLKIDDSANQTIRIFAKGENLKLFDTHLDPQFYDSELIVPDVVSLFVKCANLGMFCGSNFNPIQSQASLLMSNFNALLCEETWEVKCEGIDQGGFRVLMNLLVARNMDSLKITALRDNSHGIAAQISKLPSYPSTYAYLPFKIQHEMPLKNTGIRSVQISFLQEPSDEILENIYDALRLWSDLLTLGGFAPKNVHPTHSGTFPDLAFLYSSVIIEQLFLEAFICDEMAFNSIINWAIRFHEFFPVESIVIN